MDERIRCIVYILIQDGGEMIYKRLCWHLFQLHYLVNVVEFQSSILTASLHWHVNTSITVRANV